MVRSSASLNLVAHESIYVFEWSEVFLCTHSQIVLTLALKCSDTQLVKADKCTVHQSISPVPPAERTPRAGARSFPS